MNGPFVKQQAAQLAKRLEKEEADESARVNRLYLLALNRPAGVAEIESATAFLDQGESDFEENGRDQAWIQLCHAILGSNDFLFRE